MKSNNLIARAQRTINASIDKVWNALTNPEIIKQYMFGAKVKSDWVEGSKITWKGEWKGKPYEDKGEILQIKKPTKLQYSHFSPLTGKDDIPENYHVVTINLINKGNQTTISLSQNKNENKKEQSEAQKNWTMMLTSLKKLLEESD